MQKLFLAWLVLCLIGCGPGSHEEMMRVTSPDKAVDAVLVRTNAGATTAFGYELHLVPTGGKPQRGHEKLRADHLTDVTIRWQQPKFLQVQYKEGRIFHFSNFWQSKEVQDFKYVVEIRLMPLTQSFSLSARDRHVDDSQE